MKIERRDNSVFIAHNGLSIFFNKFEDKATHEQSFSIRVNKAELERGSGLVKKWHFVGDMVVDRAGYDQLCAMMNQLVFNGEG